MKTLLLAIFLALAVRSPAQDYSSFQRDKLAAWCIVPFDSKKRGPEERAEMLNRLGITRLAYDWRDEQVPTFDAEVDAMKSHGVEISAWWMSQAMDDKNRKIFEVIERHQIHPQLWLMIGEPAGDQEAKVKAAAAQIRPIAEEGKRLGCQVALYNHGGWFGEPMNQIAIIEELKMPNVGMVYNFHHGHEHVAKFAELFAAMKPHLFALNLNGMKLGGPKIMPIGAGDQEREMIRTVAASGWQGPIGVLCHLPDQDAEKILTGNLQGLDRVIDELDPAGHWTIEDPAARAKLPEFQTIPAGKIEDFTTVSDSENLGAGKDWLRSHGDEAGTRFSKLSQITPANVANLKPAWTYHSGDGTGNIQCNPVIVDGVVYAPTVGQNMVAIDGRTGVEKWRFKPEGKPAYRGLLYWRNPKGGEDRLLFAAGKFFYALNPKDGQPVKSFGEGGRIASGEVVVAPVVFQNILAMPGFDKDVYGYDLESGKLLWTFHTVPQPGEEGYETWSKTEIGANCWGGIAMDEERGIVYISTGSPKPNFVGVNHRGDNLYGNCLLAIDMRTGKRLWHFQEIRHDIWDLDIPAPPNLVTVTRDAKKIAAVAVVTKIGDTLLLDRVTGQPLHPFRLRRAPVSKLAGERTAPYQPDVELPERFAAREFTLDSVTDRTPAAHAFVMNQLQRANMGWFVPFEEGKPTALFGFHGGAEWTGAAVDPKAGRLYVSASHVPWIVTVYRTDEVSRKPGDPPTRGEEIFGTYCIACHGAKREGLGVAPPLQGLRHRLTEEQVFQILANGRNGMPPAPPMSDADKRALVDSLLAKDRPQTKEAAGAPPRFINNGYPRLLDDEGYPGTKPPWGTLNCIDLASGKILWRVPLGQHAELEAKGITGTGTENFGGAIATASGLIFCGGTRDEMIRAFDAKDGKELWKAKLPFGGFAPPATYEIDGKQYVIIPATGGGKLGQTMGDAYVAFALE